MSPEAIRNLDALNVTMNGGSTLLNVRCSSRYKAGYIH